MGGWKWSQGGLSHTSRNFRGRGNLFLNAVWVQSRSPTPAPHSAVVTGDIAKGYEANCINQGSVLILSPLLVFCIRRVWLCQQHNVKVEASKICKSFRCTLVFHLSYLRLWAVHYNFQRAPEVQLLGQWPERGSEKCLVVRNGLNIIPCATFSTLVDCSNTAGNWNCCMWGFFFIYFCPTEESPAARAAFTGSCLEVPIRFYCAGQLRQQRVFHHCIDVGLRGL